MSSVPSSTINQILPFTGLSQLVESKERAKTKAAAAKAALAESEAAAEEAAAEAEEDAETAADELASEEATLSPEEKEAAEGVKTTKPTIKKSLLSEYATTSKKTSSLI